jgi:hypothetical protein
MEDESIHNNPRDLAKEIFARLEARVTDVKHNMKLLMVPLPRNLISFIDDGGYNLEII